MILVLGLGNPGSEYKKSRHNVGFSVLDEVSKLLSIKFQEEKKKKYSSLKYRVGTEDVLFVKPLTYMNASGNIFPHFRHEEITRLIVCVDNMDLESGRVRLREGGGSAGHNGLKSIIAHFGENFFRFYIGVGRPEGDVKDHVLSSPKVDDKKKIDEAIIRTAKVLLDFIENNDLEKAQHDLAI